MDAIAHSIDQYINANHKFNLNVNTWIVNRHWVGRLAIIIPRWIFINGCFSFLSPRVVCSTTVFMTQNNKIHINPSTLISWIRRRGNESKSWNANGVISLSIVVDSICYLSLSIFLCFVCLLWQFDCAHIRWSFPKHTQWSMFAYVAKAQRIQAKGHWFRRHSIQFAKNDFDRIMHMIASVARSTIEMLESFGFDEGNICQRYFRAKCRFRFLEIAIRKLVNLWNCITIL